MRVEENPAVGLSQRAGAYAVLFDSALGLRDFTRGNLAASEMVKSERAVLGESSPARASGLYQSANWYRRTSQLSRERKLLSEAIAILEKAYGVNDSRLACPLRLLATSHLVGHDNAKKSRAFLDRALDLPAGQDPDAQLERAMILASLGDHEIVFGDPTASGAYYSRAWRLAADHPLLGTAVANRLFATPLPLYVKVPSEPFRGSIVRSEYMVAGDYFADGAITFEFIVTAEGLVDELHIHDKDIELGILPTPIVKAFQNARYRPRVLDGQPVPTPDQQFSMEFIVERK